MMPKFELPMERIAAAALVPLPLGRCDWCGRADGRRECVDCYTISCGRSACDEKHAAYITASPRSRR